MSNFFSTLIDKTLSYVKNSFEVSLSISFVSFIVLCNKDLILKQFQLTGKDVTYVLLVFGLSSAIALAHIIKFIKSVIIDWVTKNKKFKILNHLTNDEKQVLKRYVVNGETVIEIPAEFQDGVLSGLVNKGVLYCPKVTSYFIDRISFGIIPEFLGYLKKNTKYLK
jgi:hypothetical protein